MIETEILPQAQAAEADAAQYAGADDTPGQVRARRALVRIYASQEAYPGRLVTEWPHLAADLAMRVLVPVMAEVAAAAQASQHAACVEYLRAEGADLAATALEASGPDVAVVARDAAALTAAAGTLAGHPPEAQ